jgi:2',3'-cyclic-nucleotide 2'-phosphodiesterase/3'-nucleotidase
VAVGCDLFDDLKDALGGNDTGTGGSGTGGTGTGGTGNGGTGTGGSGTGGSGTGGSEDLDNFTVDIYALNDVHGKFVDDDLQPGVDEMTTYLKKMQAEQNAILLSAGDMWQGSAESGLTKGNIITDWMNDLGFSAMTVGNHEFDWGTDVVAQNAEIAEFPLLAINVYDKDTNQRVDYCDASVMVDKGAVQIGVIGAIGDCYSSISADQVEDIYFKTDDDLTTLVKEESNKLKAEGADFIVYVLHDGYGRSYSTVKNLSGNEYESDGGVYYDTSLSNGYVDLVFEGHSHQSYILKDEYGVYHLQGGGDNKKGMTHAEIFFDFEDDSVEVRDAGFIHHTSYTSMAEDPVVDNLVEKYDSVLGSIYDTIGRNAYTRDSSDLKNLVAKLYYEAGAEEWGDDYDIVLGGGYLSVRSPYDLYSGVVCYADLYMLLPFDNEIVLCSIKGSDLRRRYFQNSSYYMYYSDYGNSVKSNLDVNKTYYIITDTYNSSYASNRLTVVATLGNNVYARDLVADYVKAGKLA